MGDGIEETATVAQNKGGREQDQVQRLLCLFLGQAERVPDQKPLGAESWAQRTQGLLHSHPVLLFFSLVSSLQAFPENRNSRGQPCTILSEDEGSSPPGHRTDVTKLFNERTSPHCPPKLAGINQNARILQGWRLEMQRYMKCFQFAFSQITSYALKGKLVFFDYDDAHQLLTAHLGEQENARGTQIGGKRV